MASNIVGPPVSRVSDKEDPKRQPVLKQRHMKSNVVGPGCGPCESELGHETTLEMKTARAPADCAPPIGPLPTTSVQVSAPSQGSCPEVRTIKIVDQPVVSSKKKTSHMWRLLKTPLVRGLIFLIVFHIALMIVTGSIHAAAQ